MADYYFNITFEVARTGKLKQYYTLYRNVSCGLPGFWARESYRYVQNLSHDLDEAISKAEKIANNRGPVEYVESPKVEFDNFTAFDLKWKNGYNCYYAIPDNKFWAIWRDNKESLKKMGFWVSKPKKGNTEFMVFCRLDASDEIIGGLSELPELKTDYPKIENGRQKLAGELTAVKESYSDTFGTITLRATFQLENGYKINGTIPKGLSSDDIGKSFSFNGTVEDQGNGFGFYKRPSKAEALYE